MISYNIIPPSPCQLANNTPYDAFIIRENVHRKLTRAIIASLVSLPVSPSI
jgi:hypothetical protein